MPTSCNNDSETIYLLAGKAVTCIYIYPFLDPTYAEASCTRHAPIKVAMKMKQLSKNGTAAKHWESLGKDPQSEIICSFNRWLHRCGSEFVRYLVFRHHI